MRELERWLLAACLLLISLIKQHKHSEESFAGFELSIQLLS